MRSLKRPSSLRRVADGPGRSRTRRYDRAPVQYPVETFTPAERGRLQAHCSNLERPVFALVNLPETVKGALFARYSRYQGTLRRLLLDEFAADLPEVPLQQRTSASEGTEEFGTTLTASNPRGKY